MTNFTDTIAESIKAEIVNREIELQALKDAYTILLTPRPAEATAKKTNGRVTARKGKKRGRPTDAEKAQKAAETAAAEATIVADAAAAAEVPPAPDPVPEDGVEVPSF